MTVIRLATAVWHSSTLPRDAAMINPVIETKLPSPDYQALVDDWMTAFKTWSGIGTTSQILIKAYDAESPAPNQPLAEKLVNPGVAAGVGSPREIAVSLSFFSTFNVKRRRGRLYVPFFWLFPASQLAERPDATVRAKVGSLAGALQNLGGADVDWSVYSKVEGQARPVTDWWVDDEWDTQRRRGLRATTRLTGVTSEAGLP